MYICQQEPLVHADWFDGEGNLWTSNRSRKAFDWVDRDRMAALD